MCEERTITLVDIIIDRHGRIDLADVARDLKHARIGGCDVLHVLVKDVNLQPKDEVPIPHAGHSMVRCRQEQWCWDKLVNHAWLRNFNLQLVLDGALRMAEQEVTEFELRRDVLVMLSNVMVVPPIPEHTRYDLVKPWTRKVGTSYDW